MSSFPFYSYALVISVALIAPATGIKCLIGNQNHAVLETGFKYCITVRDYEINKEVYSGTNEYMDLSRGRCFIEMVENSPLEYCYCTSDQCNNLIRFKYFPFLNFLLRRIQTI